MEEDIIKTLGDKIVKASENLKSEELKDILMPMQMDLKVNIKRIPNDNIKISLFLLEALITKIMSGIVERVIFGGKDDADKSGKYNSFFIENLEVIGKAIISKDEDKIFEEIKSTILKAGKEGLLKI